MHSRRIVKNTIFLYVRMLVVLAVGLYTSRVLLDSLGVEDFGLYNVVGSVVTSLAFLTNSLATAGARFFTCSLGENDRLKLNDTYSTTINIQLILAVLIAVAMSCFGKWMLSSRINIPEARSDAVGFALYAVIATTGIRLLSVPFTSAIIAYERMDAFAWLSIFDVSAKLGIAYSIATSSCDRLKLYSLLLLGVELVYFVVMIGYSRRTFKELRYKFSWNARLMKEIFAFAGWQALTGIGVMLGTQGYTIINQKYFGAGLVAAFSVAMMVQGHVMQFIANFKTAANPQIIKYYASGRTDEAKTLLIDTTVFSVVIFLVLAVPLFVYADRILGIWLVEIPRWTVAFVRIVLISAYFSIYDTSLYIALYAIGRLKENVLLNLLISIVCFGVAWIAIVKYGNPYTTALTSLAGVAAVALVVKPMILSKVLGFTGIDFKYLFLPGMRILLPTTVIGFVFYRYTPQGIFPFVLGGGLCVISTGIVLWTMALSVRQKKWAIGLICEKVPVLKAFFR